MRTVYCEENYINHNKIFISECSDRIKGTLKLLIMVNCSARAVMVPMRALVRLLTCLWPLMKFFRLLIVIRWQNFQNQNVFQDILRNFLDPSPTPSPTGLESLQIWLDTFSYPPHLTSDSSSKVKLNHRVLFSGRLCDNISCALLVAR